MISNDLIKELQNIIKEDYGIILSQQKTQSLAEFLIDYFTLLVGINKDEDK